MALRLDRSLHHLPEVIDSDIRPRIREYFKPSPQPARPAGHLLDPLQGPLCYLDVVRRPLSGDKTRVLVVNLDVFDVMLILQMLEQLGLGFEFAGAGHHVAGEAVGLQVVRLQ